MRNIRTGDSHAVRRGILGWETRAPDFPNPNSREGNIFRQDWINREHMSVEEEMPQAKTFAMGLEFLESNKEQDDWFLQIETFDPHEPYFVSEKYKELYDFDFSKSTRDWPSCTNAEESPDHVELFDHFRKINAALVSMCDEHLGKILDKMDECDLWSDTMLIVNTDHGFLLGEHDWWGKCIMPFYNEIAHTPFFVWDPRCGISGERRQSLVQTIDIAPTILDYFGLKIPKDMQGKSLRGAVESDAPIRDAGLFGRHGGNVNVTDGRYVYMRAPVNEDNSPLYQYTHMPAHMRGPFTIDEMRRLEGLAEPFEFTKGCKTMKIKSKGGVKSQAFKFGHKLFDLESDPNQEHPLDDPEVEKMMIDHLIREMRANDAPPEQYERLGLPSSKFGVQLNTHFRSK